MDNMKDVQGRRNILKVAGLTAFTFAAGQSNARDVSPAPLPLFATESGTGKNLMLLHGWTCDSNDWSWQLPYFESKYRVVAVDLRGHGHSKVTPSGTYTPSHYVRDIEELIDSRFRGEKFILVGHSMGAQIAARLALKRADLVSSIISVDGALGFSDTVGRYFQKTERELQGGKPSVVVPPLFQSVYDAHTNPAFKRWHARRIQSMPDHVVRETFSTLFTGPDQIGVGANSARFCKKIKVPVYHLCRDSDQAERMRQWFPHPKSKVDVWAKAGHWIMQDRPADVNSAITNWLATLGSGAIKDEDA